MPGQLRSTSSSGRRCRRRRHRYRRDAALGHAGHQGRAMDPVAAARGGVRQGRCRAVYLLTQRIRRQRRQAERGGSWPPGERHNYAPNAASAPPTMTAPSSARPRRRGQIATQSALPPPVKARADRSAGYPSNQPRCKPDIPAMAAVEDCSALRSGGPMIPLRIYRLSTDSAAPGICTPRWWPGHGHQPLLFRATGRALAAASGATVVAVGYRLAPRSLPGPGGRLRHGHRLGGRHFK